VEYRLETGPPDRGILSVVSGGQRISTSVDLDESTGLRRLEGTDIIINAPNRLHAMTVDLPVGISSDVSLWVHTVGPDGGSVRTPVDVRIHDGSADKAFRVADEAMSAFAVEPTTEPGAGPARLTISLAPGRMPA
jgi:hypothetical protein